MSLGLNYPKMMVFIILPQALQIVIPGIVNTFIGLFKDTSLVAIVGIFDLIRTIEASRIDPNWAARPSPPRDTPLRPCSISSSAGACRGTRSGSSGVSRRARNGDLDANDHDGDCFHPPPVRAEKPPCR